MDKNKYGPIAVAGFSLLYFSMPQTALCCYTSRSRLDFDPNFRGGLADEAVRLLDEEVVLKRRPDRELADDGDDGRHGLEVGEAVSHALPGTEAEGREGGGRAFPVHRLVQEAGGVEPAKSESHLDNGNATRPP